MVETPIKHDLTGDNFLKVKTGFRFLGENPERDVDHFFRKGVKSRTNHKMKIMDNLWQVSEDGLTPHIDAAGCLIQFKNTRL